MDNKREFGLFDLIHYTLKNIKLFLVLAISISFSISIWYFASQFRIYSGTQMIIQLPGTDSTKLKNFIDQNVSILKPALPQVKFFTELIGNKVALNFLFHKDKIDNTINTRSTIRNSVSFLLIYYYLNKADQLTSYEEDVRPQIPTSYHIDPANFIKKTGYQYYLKTSIIEFQNKFTSPETLRGDYQTQLKKFTDNITEPQVQKLFNEIRSTYGSPNDNLTILSDLPSYPYPVNYKKHLIAIFIVSSILALMTILCKDMIIYYRNEYLSNQKFGQ